MWQTCSCLGLGPLDDFPKIFSKNERNLSNGAKQKIPLCRIRAASGSEKEQPAREILSNAREITDEISCFEKAGQVEVQEILKMWHFPRIERKFQWNQ